jgi:hypothetical protein
VWWEECEEEAKETYYDLTDEQFALIVASEDAEIIEHTAKDRPGEPEDEEKSVDVYD